MKKSHTTGMSFGITSGIITTLGLIVGLHSTMPSKLVVIGGVAVIAFGDALSDAFGIHMAEESKKINHKKVWESTIATFLTKMVFSLSFLVPILLLPLSKAIIASIVWGLVAITAHNFYLAKKNKKNPFSMITEHVSIAIVVVIATHFIGVLIRHFFS